MSIKELAGKFKALPSGTKTAIIGGVIVVALFTVGTIYSPTPDSGPQKQKSDTGKENLNIYTPGNREATENVAAAVDATNKKLQESELKIKLLEETNKDTKSQSSADGHWTEISNLVAQVQSLQEKVNAMGGGLPVRQPGAPAAPGNTKTNLDAPLSTTGSDGDKTEPPAAAPVPPPVSIQVVREEKKAAAKVKSKKAEPSAYVPSGSNFEAVLLNGMDASTAIGANRTPTPALLRIKSEAILPNLFSFNVRECFVMVGGYGNMSSERVEMRTESMSCIDESGAVWEGKIEGYLVGEDGKAGARGRVVSKQGALLAKTFMAGFVGGLGSAFTPQPVQSLNLAGGPTSNYQMPSTDQVVGSGIATGLNKSSTALAGFYIKLAEQMFPIVELDAGRKMTIILLKGVDLKMEKKTNG